MTKETTDQRGERIAAELRAATREAAGVLKDMQSTLAKARDLVDRYAATRIEEVMNGYLKQCQAAVDGWNTDMQADVNRLQQKAAEVKQHLLDTLGDLYDIKITETHEVPGVPDAVRHIEGTFVPKRR